MTQSNSGLYMMVSITGQRFQRSVVFVLFFSARIIVQQIGPDEPLDYLTKAWKRGNQSVLATSTHFSMAAFPHSFILCLVILTSCSCFSSPQPSPSTSFIRGLFTNITNQLEELTISTKRRVENQNLDKSNTLPHSDLTDLEKDVYIVTTACLPWMTGTAVNPLMRASHLARVRANSTGCCTLAVPFISDLAVQRKLFKNVTFTTKQEQGDFVRSWLNSSNEYAGEKLNIVFYDAVYVNTMRSIFAMGDLPSVVTSNSTGRLDAICILEEPEHLNWYRAPGPSWREKFTHVVGICHTNYKAYAESLGMLIGVPAGTAVAQMSALITRAHCDRVILLSEALPLFAAERTVVSNVHGVRSDFFCGELSMEDLGVYFIGKLLWAKGLDLLLDLEVGWRKIRHCHEYFPVTIFGSGADEDEIRRAFLGTRRNTTKSNNLVLSSFNNLTKYTKLGEVDWGKVLVKLRRQPVPATFPGAVDHASLKSKHGIFLNPSITEVLCTTAAEALAMNKWVILPNHPSNKFFMQFKNCLTYKNKQEFVECLDWARKQKREPLLDEKLHLLTWEAATERLCDAVRLSDYDEAMLGLRMSGDLRISAMLGRMGEGRSGDLLRASLGAGAAAYQVDYSNKRNGVGLETYSVEALESEIRRRNCFSGVEKK